MQKLQLSIPEPCHENWQQMTPTDQGRFCNACAKEVVDLSMMSDTEVLNYFTTLTHEKVCGRALPSQLERSITRPKEPKKRLFWYWNYIVMFFMFFGKGNSAKAQGGVKIATEQLNLNKSTNISNALAGRVGGLMINNNKIIKGKIIDKAGNPVSFASIRVKGTANAVSADAYGVFSIKATSNDLITISSAGCKTIDVKIGSETYLSIALEKTALDLGEIVVTTVAGGMKRRITCGTNTVKTNTVNPIIVFEIKEDNTGLPIDKAAIIITRKGDIKSDKILSDNKGICKFTEIKMNDSYFIKVEAKGYEPNEFTIDAKDLIDRKDEWEVLLKKQKTEVPRSTAVASLGKETTVRLGGVSAIRAGGTALFVVDGTIMSDKTDIDPDDIEDVTVLQAPQAMAIFGTLGSNGAIVITTRQSKLKNLDTVAVSSDYDSRRMGGMAGGISFTYQGSYLDETIATVKTLLTDSIKVYPNPVNRNTAFSVSLKLKQAGNYSIQVTDASGRILLQQKFNASSKNHTEKVMSDSRWAGGVYNIGVFDAKNKLVSKSSFIVQ